MTEKRRDGIIHIDGRGFLSLLYRRGPDYHNKVLFQIDGNDVKIKNPGTGEIVTIGNVIRDRDNSLAIVVFYIDQQAPPK